MDERVLTGKIKLWENRLLDLSKRNRMISFKDSGLQVIRFTDPGFEALYETLVVKGKALQIKRPIDQYQNPNIYAMIRLMHHLSERIEVGEGDISTSGTLEASTKIVKNIKKYAELALHEKGTNILYLAFGFLYWKDRSTQDAWLKAPLVLVPASLNQEQVNKPFAVKKTEEEIIINPTFSYYLESNHGIRLPQLQATDSLQALESFLDQVAVAVEKLGWYVRREVYLSTMSFLRTNMYNDLVENEDAIMAHPIIRAFAGEQNVSTTLEEKAADLRHDETAAEQVFEVLNADSSQKDAVALSRKGISFVMQGPPGTGKSQTIANIIAQGMAEGKKILFVSEKQAALDVVYRRLRDVGLSQLCLPLHDPKTSRQTVLKEIEQNLDVAKTQVGNDQLAELHQLERMRAELNSYAKLLHEKVEPLDLSLYEAYQMLFSLADVEDVIITVPQLATADRAIMNRMVQELSAYETYRDAFGEKWYAHPWKGIKKQKLSIAGKLRLRETIEAISERLEPIYQFKINEEKRLSDVMTLSDIREYFDIGRTIAGGPVVPEALVLGQQEQHGQRRPEQTNALLGEIAGALGKPEHELVADVDLIKSTCKEALALIQELSEIIHIAQGVAAELAYADVFQAREFLYQFGLDEKNLAVTPYYFSADGMKLVRNVMQKRKEQLAQGESLCSYLLKRYKPEILELDIPVEEVQLRSLLEQLCGQQAIGKGEIRKVLCTDYNICVADATDDEELLSVVTALLGGKFDRLAALTENEYYFVYDLLEEANQRGAQGDALWLSEFAQILQNYTGVDPETATPGTWAEQLVLLNDFYYIKTAHPAMLQILQMSEAEREKLKKRMRGSAIENVAQMQWVYRMQQLSLADRKPEAEQLCEDIRVLFDYRSNLRQAEATYMEDASILGNHYLMNATQWSLIEKNMAFAGELPNIFGPKKMASVAKLLTHYADFDQIRLSNVLHRLSKISATVPVIATLTVQNAGRVLAECAQKLTLLKTNLTQWDEVCRVVEKIRTRVYSVDKLVIDKDVLSMMLAEDSRQLFDMLDLLHDLQLEQTHIQHYLGMYEEPEMLMDISISNLRERLKNCKEQFDDYDTMVEYQLCAEHCRKDGLTDFIAKAYPLRAGKDQLGKMFEKAFLTAWIDMVSERTESISAFSSGMQEEKIKQFCQLDKGQLAIARERVRAASYGRMPSRSSGKVVGEMGILLREISKSRSSMTIRQLFNSIPMLLLKLKPCLMMSPLSVAYFLNAKLYTFDMVIFDEASQIFPENAISAILRGKQVIIAGDSKQMPPTSFFQTAVGSQEEETQEDAALYSDSILEEAENVLPNLSLTWHYRSRSESLITFSNKNMYAGSLVTFPDHTTKQKDTGVELQYVENGVYEERCNEQEAHTCVQLTMEHFRNHPNRSIGIIAFSVSQEECIERAFELYRAQHPEDEHFFVARRENPFFIKNLENVQGDERDTILLSVGYGRNAMGVLRYNFGPLGKQGGERRMNVAITRARYNVKLVTSLRPEDFLKEKLTENAGAKLLHDYIAYAMNGCELGAPVETQDDGFKQHIASVLQEAGYQVTFAIGNSGYKVELAVVDPKDPGRYILGIETDGQAYCAVRTVRDRENLRPEILKGMGWRTYRAWSTQWIRDPETEKRKLLKLVAQIVAGTEAVQ